MDAKALTSILNSLSASFHNPTLHLYPSTHKNFEWILFNPKDMKLAREAYDNNEINLRTDPNIPQVDSLFHEDALICQPISKISSDLMKMFNAGVLKKLSNECIDKCFDILSRFVLIDARKLNHEMAFLFFSISPSLLAINSLNNWEKYNISDYLMMCMKVSKFLKFHQNEDECSRCKRFDNNKCFAAILYEQKQLLMFIRKRIELFCCEFLSKVISFCFESIFDSKFHLYFDNLFLLVEIYSKFSQFREAILNQYLASMYMIMETEKHITINKKKVSIFTYGILTIFQSSLLFRIQTDNDLNILISEFYNLVGVIKNFFQCVIEIYSQKNQNFLLTIIKDLCNIWFNPEWSIVDILLKNIMDILTVNVSSCDTKQKNIIIDCILSILTYLQKKDCTSIVNELREKFTKLMAPIYSITYLDNLTMCEVIICQHLSLKLLNNSRLKSSLEFFSGEIIFYDYLTKCFLKNNLNDDSNLENIKSSPIKSNTFHEDHPSCHAKEKMKLLKLVKAYFNKSYLISDFNTNEYEICCKFIQQNLFLFQCIPFYFNKIKELINDPLPSIRLKILRGFLIIMNNEVLNINKQPLYNLVCQRLLDPSISIREIAVEIYSKNLFSASIIENIDDVSLNTLSDRLNDIGISVRKKVIKIFKENVIKIKSQKLRSVVFVKIFSRIYDEQSVLSLIKELFLSYFVQPFETYPSNIDNVYLFVEMVKQVDEEHYDFELIVTKLFSDGLSQYLNCFTNLSRHLIIELSFEKSTNEIFSVLKFLTKLLPHLLTGEFYIFENYLLRAKEIESSCLSNVCTILGNLLPHIKILKDENVKNIYVQLSDFILKKGASVISEAIYVLHSLLIYHYNDHRPFIDIFSKYINFLENLKATGNLDGANAGIFRTLFTLSQMIRYFGIEFFIHEEDNKLIDIALFFVKCEVLEISLKASFFLGIMVCKKPSYLSLEHVYNFYLSILYGDSNPLKIAILSSISNILTDEKNRLKNIEHKKSVTELHFNLSKITECISIVCQKFIPLIVNIFDNKEIKIRQLILEIISMTISLGLVVPVQAIDVLIAYSIDINREIATQCICNLLIINDKYPGFVQSQIVTGLKKTCVIWNMLLDSYGNKRGFNSENISLLDNLYRLIKVNNQRRNLIDTILRLITEDTFNLNQKLFLVDNLATFSYDHIEEIYFLLYKINLSSVSLFEFHMEELKKLSKSKEYLVEDKVSIILLQILMHELFIHLSVKFSINLDSLDLYSPNNSKTFCAKLNTQNFENIQFDPYFFINSNVNKNFTPKELLLKMKAINFKILSLRKCIDSSKSFSPKKRKIQNNSTDEAINNSS